MSCPKCGSWSVRRDRSLAGRMVCGRCGTPLGGSERSSASTLRRARGGLRRPPTWSLLLLLVAFAALLATWPQRSPVPSSAPMPSSQMGR